MVERNPPVWMQSGTYQASDDRMVTGLLLDRTFDKAGTQIGVEGGVVPPFDQVRVTSTGTGMGYTISSGVLFVRVPGETPPGAYICYNDGASTGAIDPALTGNPRIDLIVARVLDRAVGTGITNAWEFSVRKGSPSVNPVTPAWLPGEIPLAAIRAIPPNLNGGVNKIADTQITDLRQFVASMGGTHVRWGSGPLPPHTPGRMVFDVDNKTLLLNDGDQYQPMYTMQQILNYFAAYRPKVLSYPGNQNFDQSLSWSAGTEIAQRTDILTPSGVLKVTLTAFGKVSVASIGYGRMSVEISSAEGVVAAPATSRAVHFYNTGWEQCERVFIAENLPPAPTPLTVKIVYINTGPGVASFSNSNVIIESVL